MDLKVDGRPIGRLVVRNGRMYDFNLSKDELMNPEKYDADGNELLVDLKIDGKHGPVPKIV